MDLFSSLMPAIFGWPLVLVGAAVLLAGMILKKIVYLILSLVFMLPFSFYFLYFYNGIAKLYGGGILLFLILGITLFKIGKKILSTLFFLGVYGILAYVAYLVLTQPK
ncbi:hypothetical protein [Carboxydothermus ferrireducens]|uniref:ABC-type transport system involved in multi-copper enzyme maturation permease subunit n=1 Tax=Carboxydothermus ferrireducens DSM 11255 TaxID=1119529 RepID=A0ABX2RAU9_9THEO|nr:hypothetical protein [Carboxydothermus ferrireducens]NYE58055.1 ABC-type transport system involved in multi-copper enzyme maturation permease subunit [Carboxydothermus ferrireducens DSM 11255]